jgi:hypothetical protein
VKKFVVILFLCHDVHKIENYFIFEMLMKKIWPVFTELCIELFNQKFVTELSKIWVWDPRSGIWDPEKPISNRGSGSRGQKGTGSRIRNTAQVILFLGKRKGSNRKWGGGGGKKVR